MFLIQFFSLYDVFCALFILYRSFKRGDTSWSVFSGEGGTLWAFSEAAADAYVWERCCAYLVMVVPAFVG